MSNWTHVAGIVRIDSFRGLFFGIEPDFEAIFGKELNFDDPEERWDDAQHNPEKYLPLGSEGSLHMSLWINPDSHDFAAYTVSIFGDLRDHQDPDEIIVWFEEKCSKVMVRNACITVYNEWYGTRNWVYEQENEDK